MLIKTGEKEKDSGKKNLAATGRIQGPSSPPFTGLPPAASHTATPV
jgi:hypothetical protein